MDTQGGRQEQDRPGAERTGLAVAGLQDALAPEWRGGVTCTVVQGGAIKIGDSVRVEAEVLASSGD